MCRRSVFRSTLIYGEAAAYPCQTTEDPHTQANELFHLVHYARYGRTFSSDFSRDSN